MAFNVYKQYQRETYCILMGFQNKHYRAYLHNLLLHVNLDKSNIITQNFLSCTWYVSYLTAITDHADRHTLRSTKQLRLSILPKDTNTVDSIYILSPDSI